MSIENPENITLRLHREEIERMLGRPLEADVNESLKIDLPEDFNNEVLAEEWKIFRQEVVRLLREGHRGRFAVIKVGHPITVWDTLRDAVQAIGLLSLPQPCLVQPIFPNLRPLSTRSNRTWRT